MTTSDTRSKSYDMLAVFLMAALPFRMALSGGSLAWVSQDSLMRIAAWCKGDLLSVVLFAEAVSIRGAIMQDYLKDPVTAADDSTYEHYAITDWLSKHDTSPMTNVPLPHRDLVSNGSIKVQMQALLQQLTPAKQIEFANYLS